VTELIGTALAAVLAGDVASMASLREVPQQELAAAADGPLLLTRDAVVRVLRSYSAGEFSDAAVQSWASFVRRGYVAGGGGQPVHALPIDWEAAHEDAMAEAIERLDELGEPVDGTLREGELDELLAALA
jgi:hypothetical protein